MRKPCIKEAGRAWVWDVQATEAELGYWMDEMHGLLTYEQPALDESDPDKESVLDSVKCAVCQVGSQGERRDLLVLTCSWQCCSAMWGMVACD